MTDQALEATGPDERTYYYWAADRILADGVWLRGIPVSDEFGSREAAEAVREPIKTLHPDANLVRVTDFL